MGTGARGDGRSGEDRDGLRRIADAFAAHLGHDDAERVTPKDVSDFADHLRHNRGLKAKTINSRYLAALGSLYRLGIAKHVIKVNPVQGTEVAPERVVKVRSKGFTDDEAKAILKAALLTDDPAKRWLPWLEAYTGCRVGSLSSFAARTSRPMAGSRISA